MFHTKIQRTLSHTHIHNSYFILSLSIMSLPPNLDVAVASIELMRCRYKGCMGVNKFFEEFADFSHEWDSVVLLYLEEVEMGEEKWVEMNEKQHIDSIIFGWMYRNWKSLEGEPSLKRSIFLTAMSSMLACVIQGGEMLDFGVPEGGHWFMIPLLKKLEDYETWCGVEEHEHTRPFQVLNWLLYEFNQCRRDPVNAEFITEFEKKSRVIVPETPPPLEEEGEECSEINLNFPIIYSQ